MLRVAIAVAAVLVVAVIVYGAIQAQEELRDDAPAVVATSTVVAILQPTAAASTTGPVVLVGSDFIVQVRGGDDPCRYLYQGSVGTFAGGQIVMEFIAGTHEANLADTGEMHLYGDTGPHLFVIEDAGGDSILEVALDRGATVYADVVFHNVGLYGLYDREQPDLGRVGEIFARPIGSPGYFPVSDWLKECAL